MLPRAQTFTFDPNISAIPAAQVFPIPIFSVCCIDKQLEASQNLSIMEVNEDLHM